MSRREAVRIILFLRATLSGAGNHRVRCAVVNLSAVGALLSLSEQVPPAPLRLSFTLGGEDFDLAVELRRVREDGSASVMFPGARSERLYRVVAAAQRQALAQGRKNVSDRRLPGSRRGTPDDARPRREGGAIPPRRRGDGHDAPEGR
jgi:hypothetical protein